MNNFNKNMSIIPPLPHRFTIGEWFLNNQERQRGWSLNCQLVENIIDESNRICDATLESTNRNKHSTDRELSEKIENIKFCRNELARVRKEITLENDALVTYKSRLIDALASVKRNAALICEKCLIAREHRLGIDLVVDDVERELRKEYQMIGRVTKTLTRTLEQTEEQIRELKSKLYYIDRNLQDKDQNYEIDRENLNLRETSLNLFTYHGTASLDLSTLTMQEWLMLMNECVLDANKHLNNAKILRNYIDNILQQVVDDLNDQIDKTNSAFKERISETKIVKEKLEMQHSEIIKKANDMIHNIARLEKTIADKSSFIGLAHTRLGNRCQRPQLEMTSDAVEKQLVNEVSDLRDSVTKLQRTLFEARAILRNVLKTQIQIEEDINIKTNTLKIDEVECMTLRQGLSFHAY